VRRAGLLERRSNTVTRLGPIFSFFRYNVIARECTNTTSSMRHFLSAPIASRPAKLRAQLKGTGKHYRERHANRCGGIVSVLSLFFFSSSPPGDRGRFIFSPRHPSSPDRQERAGMKKFTATGDSGEGEGTPRSATERSVTIYEVITSLATYRRYFSAGS